MNTYLITESWLKEYTPFGEWCDVRLIVPFIKVAEDVDIRSLIGKEQYDRLIEGIDNNDLTTNENTLLDLLKPADAYAALAHAMPFLGIQIRGSGVVKTANPNIENATKGEVEMLEERMRSIYNYYAQRVINYLCDNSSLFPLANDYNQDPSRSSTQRFGSFHFGDDGDDCNCGPLS